MTEPTHTVLVVEDEETFVAALTVGLKREGFRVQVARDGGQALDLFDAVDPDIVLLDVMLPTMSGVDVCREIRRRSKVPIIMVTAKSSEVDTVVGLEVGADDYVTKPYRLRELVARMRSVLRPGRRAGGGSERRCGRGPVGGRRRAARPGRPRGDRPRRGRRAAAQGVRRARDAVGPGRPGGDPRRADRRGVGPRLRGRHQDPRRAHQAPPGARSRPTRRAPSGS